jgi:hypothetical protein
MSQPYLPESEIQRLERLDDEELASATKGKELPMFRRLLSSFRITALVANSAWAAFETKRPEDFSRFTKALSAYAPDLRGPPRPDYSERLEELKAVYLTIHGGMGAEEVQLLLYRRIALLEDLVEESGTP